LPAGSGRDTVARLSLRLIGDEIERISGYPASDFIDGSTRTLCLESPAGEGTRLRAVVPLDPRAAAAAPPCRSCGPGGCRFPVRP